MQVGGVVPLRVGTVLHEHCGVVGVKSVMTKANGGVDRWSAICVSSMGVRHGCGTNRYGATAYCGSLCKWMVVNNRGGSNNPLVVERKSEVFPPYRKGSDAATTILWSPRWGGW